MTNDRNPKNSSQAGWWRKRASRSSGDFGHFRGRQSAGRSERQGERQSGGGSGDATAFRVAEIFGNVGPKVAPTVFGATVGLRCKTPLGYRRPGGRSSAQGRKGAKAAGPGNPKSEIRNPKQIRNGHKKARKGTKNLRGNSIAGRGQFRLLQCRDPQRRQNYGTTGLRDYRTTGLQDYRTAGEAAIRPAGLAASGSGAHQSVTPVRWTSLFTNLNGFCPGYGCDDLLTTQRIAGTAP
jgi:hypothetical protein